MRHRASPTAVELMDSDRFPNHNPDRNRNRKDPGRLGLRERLRLGSLRVIGTPGLNSMAVGPAHPGKYPACYPHHVPACPHHVVQSSIHRREDDESGREMDNVEEGHHVPWNGSKWLRRFCPLPAQRGGQDTPQAIDNARENGKILP